MRPVYEIVFMAALMHGRSPADKAGVRGGIRDGKPARTESNSGEL